jgi:ABC-type multidrug transport system ATPase subunit
VLTARSVGKSFETARGKRKQVLSGVDLSVAPGRALAIVGHNGSGKSTLLRCLAGLMQPDCGEVLLDGKPISKATKLGVVLDGVRPLYPRLRVDEAVSYLLSLLGKQSKSSVAEAMRILEAMGFLEMRQQLQELSKGSQQKVAVAVALSGDPAVVICDEPSSYLDNEAKQALASELLRLMGRGSAVVVATHDAVLIRACQAERALLDDGKLSLGQAEGTALIQTGDYLIRFRTEFDCEAACEKAGDSLRHRGKSTECVVASRAIADLSEFFPDSAILSLESVEWASS